MADKERQQLSNSAARRDLIREAVQWIAEKEAERKAIGAEITQYKAKHIKGDLGFKIADWNAIYRVSQLEAEDRDTLLDTLREGFAALDIGGSLDWVSVAEAAQAPVEQNLRKRGTKREPSPAAPNEEARAQGREDGLGGFRDHAARWPSGEYGHADYVLGLTEGEAERERILAMGPSNSNGADAHPAAE